jgi:Regulator of chromosome condensation (RCC1) repeat
MGMLGCGLLVCLGSVPRAEAQSFVPTPDIAVEIIANQNLYLQRGVVGWGNNELGQTPVSGWIPGQTSDCAMIAATKDGHTELTQQHSFQWGDSYCGAYTFGSGYSAGGVHEGQVGVSSLLAYNLKSIASGAQHSLELKFDGTVRGNGGPTFYDAGVVPAGLTSVKEIAAGSFHSLALKTDGTGRAWGRNVDGQTTVPTFPIPTVTAISGGHQHSLALMANGMAFGWGDNTYGQSGMHGFGLQSISAGRHHNLAANPVSGGQAKITVTNLTPGSGTTITATTAKFKGTFSLLDTALSQPVTRTNNFQGIGHGDDHAGVRTDTGHQSQAHARCSTGHGGVATNPGGWRAQRCQCALRWGSSR